MAKLKSYNSELSQIWAVEPSKLGQVAMISASVNSLHLNNDLYLWLGTTGTWSNPFPDLKNHQFLVTTSLPHSLTPCAISHHFISVTFFEYLLLLRLFDSETVDRNSLITRLGSPFFS